MIARIQIPKGWRRLRAGETVVNGDMCFQRIAMEWMKLEGVVPTAGPVKPTEYIIRRVKRRRAKAAVKTCDQCSKQYHACPYAPFCASEMEACPDFCQREELRRGAR